MHAKRLDPMLPQRHLFPSIHIPQPNIHQLPRTNQMLLLQPPKHILSLLPRQPRQKRQRHPMNMPARTLLRRIDIGMRIDPHNSHLTTQPLPNRLRSPGYRAHGNRVVATKREHHATFSRVLVDLLAELLVRGADGDGFLHASVVWVRRGQEVIVVVHRVVMMDLVA